jgi:peptide/nickel transport system substrate-binding protein
VPPYEKRNEKADLTGLRKESNPGDHYTVVRNPMYYRAAEGLPYLESVVFRIVTNQD